MRSLQIFMVQSAVFMLGAFFGAPGASAAEDIVGPEEQIIKEAKLSTDNASLIAFLRNHSHSDDELLHLDQLIRQLGNPVFQKREEASAKLIALQLIALPALRQARTDKDREIARRAKNCVEQIMRDSHAKNSAGGRQSGEH